MIGNLSHGVLGRSRITRQVLLSNGVESENIKPNNVPRFRRRAPKVSQTHKLGKSLRKAGVKFAGPDEWSSAMGKSLYETSTLRRIR
jgi:hypothetical protein